MIELVCYVRDEKVRCKMLLRFFVSSKSEQWLKRPIRENDMMCLTGSDCLLTSECSKLRAVLPMYLCLQLHVSLQMTCDEGWVLLSFRFKIDSILRVCQIMQKIEFPCGVCVQPSHEICILNFILAAERQTDPT